MLTYRLVARRQQRENPEDPPDFVISADTVVVKDEVIMEKPVDQQDNLRMLADLNGNKVCHSPLCSHSLLQWLISLSTLVSLCYFYSV